MNGCDPAEWTGSTAWAWHRVQAYRSLMIGMFGSVSKDEEGRTDCGLRTVDRGYGFEASPNLVRYRYALSHVSRQGSVA